MTKIRGVMFDAFKTLIDLRPSYPGAFAEVCQHFGYEVREADVARILPEWERMENERYRQPGDFRCSAEEMHERWVELNGAIFRAVGVDGNARELSDEMERRFNSGRYTQAYEDALPALERLADEGYRLGVISNGTPGVAHCLELASITERVEFVLVSALVGWEKPAPRIFRMGLERLGLAPEEVVFIGDHIDVDVRGSRAAGMRPVMIDREGRIETPPHCPLVSDMNGFTTWLASQMSPPK